MRREDVDSINFINVLNCIENSPASPSRAEIAKTVGLSRTAVSYIVQKLMAFDLVCEHGREKNEKPGRPGTLLALDPSVWHSIGASFYSRKWLFVDVDLCASVQREHAIAVGAEDQDEILQALIDGLVFMKESCAGKVIPAFGVGAPGLVDTSTGFIERADDLGWNNRIDLRDLIRRKTGMNSYVLNRYCANGIEEVEKKRYARSYSNIVYLGIGTGMAGAVFMGGSLIQNSKHRLGHIVIDPNGPLCHCGQRGCLQAMVCEGAWLAIARQMGLPSVATGLEIAALAEAGNPAARSCILRISDILSRGLAIIVNVLNPDLLILGGPLGSSSPFLLDRVRDDMKGRILDFQYRNLTLAKGDAEEYSSAVGAALFPLKHKYELITSSSCE